MIFWNKFYFYNLYYPKDVAYTEVQSKYYQAAYQNGNILMKKINTCKYSYFNSGVDIEPRVHRTSNSHTQTWV
jgi:hypothetical protein